LGRVVLSLWFSPSCHTVPKACATSKKTAEQTFFSSSAFQQCWLFYAPDQLSSVCFDIRIGGSPFNYRFWSFNQQFLKDI
jgi:hypothetical protein